MRTVCDLSLGSREADQEEQVLLADLSWGRLDGCLEAQLGRAVSWLCAEKRIASQARLAGWPRRPPGSVAHVTYGGSARGHAELAVLRGRLAWDIAPG